MFLWVEYLFYATVFVSVSMLILLGGFLWWLSFFSLFLFWALIRYPIGSVSWRFSAFSFPLYFYSSKYGDCVSPVDWKESSLKFQTG
jgi:hypothetical protein